MKRSSLSSGLIGLLLAAGLVVVPTAAATTTVDPDPTATESATPTSETAEATNPADDATEPAETADAASQTPESTDETASGAPADVSPGALEEDAAPEVSGDPGAIIESEQLSDDATVVGIYRNGCTLTFEIAIKVAGTYTLGVWDDGVQVGTVTVSGEAGTTQTATYAIGANVGTEAPGLGFVLLDSASNKVQEIEWDFEGSGSVMAQCAAAAATTAPVASAKPVAAAKPAPQLAKTGVSTGVLAVGVLALAGAGLALRRARSQA